MIWLLVFGGWFVAVLIWMRVPVLRALPMPAISSAAVGIPVAIFFGIFAGIVMAVWAWRLPSLMATFRDAVLQKRRRQQTYTLIVLLANGVAVNRPVWSVMRDSVPKMPRMIGVEVRRIVAASRVRPGYTAATGLESLGVRWNVPELVVAGHIAEVATNVDSPGAAKAYQSLMTQLQARSKRFTEIRKSVSEFSTGAIILAVILGIVFLAIPAVPIARTFYMQTATGHIVFGIASVFIAGGLSMAERVWRRQEQVAGAAV